MFAINTCLRVDSAGRVPVAHGTPVTTTPCPHIATYPVTNDLCVQRVSDAEAEAVTGETKRVTEGWVMKAIAVLHHRENTLFDPLTGGPLDFRNDSIAGATETGREVFPRIDPAVIGLIELAGQDRILIAENAQRRGFYSLIAGYVGLGETCEEAMVREALEETGRRISQVRYVRSQPWPYSGALMMGMVATTTDEHPIQPLDGELARITWASRSELREGVFTLPHRNSLAFQLITEWVGQHD
ncbi:NUDIX domain-containing protein [Corynebacterium diphtheriae]|nr:NAD(+) diphosphatase [Corynebacterium diphtheriae]CAB0687136.1 NUDIX domain-containing protein [Corynebacterium diphtheriae]CAB0687325.1 NUDIX domain-containing protein [Corynebacterium diphtheriae]CAB0743194.1 NUDIX domain-containing protein [Corynebacterium diphtheriae]CAB0769765.1 NUDIX domain-containing protein [Corynebacterium diphtheriae]CAB0776790.1 NUDIX domain-containing protein [Corynebacterium diphtheriae]